VLVSQPTHPAFYERDERQFTCNVCNGAFNVPPPSRHELMMSFTGEDLAALLEVGCIIAAEKKKSVQMEEILRNNSHIRQVRMMNHWVKGVYLITEVEVDGASDGSDCIVAVNITRQIDATELPDELQALARKKVGEATRVSRVIHHIGGPCMDGADYVTAVALLHATHPDEVEAHPKVAVGGNQGGLWIVGDLKDVAAMAASDAERRDATIEVKCFWGTARWSRTQLLGELARGGWGMCRSEAADTFPTEAVVNTAANAGEGQAAPSGGFPKHDELWVSLVAEGCNRLIYAPDNEMSRDEDEEEGEQRTPEEEDQAARELNERMAKHREQLKQQLLAQQARSTEMGSPETNATEPKEEPSPMDEGPPDCD